MNSDRRIAYRVRVGPILSGVGEYTVVAYVSDYDADKVDLRAVDAHALAAVLNDAVFDADVFGTEVGFFGGEITEHIARLTVLVFDVDCAPFNSVLRLLVVGHLVLDVGVVGEDDIGDGDVAAAQADDRGAVARHNRRGGFKGIIVAVYVAPDVLFDVACFEHEVGHKHYRRHLFIDRGVLGRVVGGGFVPVGDIEHRDSGHDVERQRAYRGRRKPRVLGIKRADGESDSGALGYAFGIEDETVGVLGIAERGFCGVGFGNGEIESRIIDIGGLQNGNIEPVGNDVGVGGVVTTRREHRFKRKADLQRRLGVGKAHHRNLLDAGERYFGFFAAHGNFDDEQSRTHGRDHAVLGNGGDVGVLVVDAPHRSGNGTLFEGGFPFDGEGERHFVGGDDIRLVGTFDKGEDVAVRNGDFVLGTFLHGERLAVRRGDRRRGDAAAEFEHIAADGAAGCGRAFVIEPYRGKVEGGGMHGEFVAVDGDARGDGYLLGARDGFGALFGHGGERHDRLTDGHALDDAVGVNRRNGGIGYRPFARGHNAVERRILRGKQHGSAHGDRICARKRNRLHFLVGYFDIAFCRLLFGGSVDVETAVSGDAHFAVRLVDERSDGAAGLFRRRIEVRHGPLHAVARISVRRQNDGIEQRLEVDDVGPVFFGCVIGQIYRKIIGVEAYGLHADMHLLRDIATYESDCQHHYQRNDDKDAYHDFLHRYSLANAPLEGSYANAVCCILPHTYCGRQPFEGTKARGRAS